MTDQPDYYKYETAAPEAHEALYLKHGIFGWLPILQTQTDIELDYVMVCLGRRSETQPISEFPVLHRSDYDRVESLIFKREALKGHIIHEDDWNDIDPEPADDLVDSFPDHPTKY